MLRRLVVLLLLCVWCAACGTRQSAGADPDGMIRLLLTKDLETAPEEFIADYRYVALGETRKPIGAINQLIVTDDRIVVVDIDRSQAVFIFDHDGKSCAEIYGTGRGPHEYNYLEHVALVPGDPQQLALLDASRRKVLFYNLDGSFVRSLPIPYGFSGIEYLNKDEILCYTTAYAVRDPFFKGRADIGRLLYFTDDAFQIEASALQNRVKNREIGFTVPFVERSGEELLVNPNLNDTIYRVDRHGLQPLYYVDRSALGPVEPTENLTDEQVLKQGDTYSSFWGLFTSGEKFLFVGISMPPKGVIDQYCYSKASGKIYLVKNDSRLGDPVLADLAFSSIVTSWGDQFVAQIPAYVVPMVYREGTDNPVLKGVGEDDNPVLVFYTLKEPGS